MLVLYEHLNVKLTILTVSTMMFIATLQLVRIKSFILHPHSNRVGSINTFAALAKVKKLIDNIFYTFHIDWQQEMRLNPRRNVFTRTKATIQTNREINGQKAIYFDLENSINRQRASRQWWEWSIIQLSLRKGSGGHISRDDKRRLFISTSLISVGVRRPASSPAERASLATMQRDP